MGLPSKIQLAGLVITTAALPWSPFGTSLGMGLLALSWIVAVAIKATIKPESKLLAIALIACFAWYSLGLLWSENIVEGLAAVKIKLPLLIVPLSLFYVKRDPLTLKIAVKTLIISTLFAAIAGLIYGGFIEPGNYSPYISHIRMGLLLALCLGLAVLEKKWTFTAVFGVVALLSVWHTQSLTGVCMIAFTLFYTSVALSWAMYRVQTTVTALLTCIITGGIILFSMMPNTYSGELETHTPWGNEYTHYPERHLEENGHKVYINLAIDEMRPEWNKVSLVPFDSLDANGFPLKSTLTRYLTSQGKPKNGAQIASLSHKDISNIESGHTSVRISTHSGLSLRIDELKFELGNYLDGGNPNGNSVTMRLESFKAGTYVLKKGGLITLLFGKGTGDLTSSLNRAYVETESRLHEKFWKRTHNQYLAWWIECGLIGLTLWLVVLLASWNSIEGSLKLAWWIVAISCLAEDTLETQAGVTFAALAITIFTLVPTKRN